MGGFKPKHLYTYFDKKKKEGPYNVTDYRFTCASWNTVPEGIHKTWLEGRRAERVRMQGNTDTVTAMAKAKCQKRKLSAMNMQTKATKALNERKERKERSIV